MIFSSLPVDSIRQPSISPRLSKSSSVNFVRDRTVACLTEISQTGGPGFVSGTGLLAGLLSDPTAGEADTLRRAACDADHVRHLIFAHKPVPDEV
jgi:hypothetical protein